VLLLLGSTLCVISALLASGMVRSKRRHVVMLVVAGAFLGVAANLDALGGVGGGDRGVWRTVRAGFALSASWLRGGTLGFANPDDDGDNSDDSSVWAGSVVTATSSRGGPASWADYASNRRSDKTVRAGGGLNRLGGRAGSDVVTCSVPDLMDDHARSLLLADIPLYGCNRTEDDPIFATVAPGKTSIEIDPALCAGGVSISVFADPEVSELRYERVREGARDGVALEVPAGQDFAFVRCTQRGPRAKGRGAADREMRNLVFADRSSRPEAVAAARDAALERRRASEADTAWAGPRVVRRPNVVVLLLDAASRAQMLRTMPETVALLESGSAARGDGADLEGTQVFNFSRYHALGTRTPPNVGPMLGGRRVSKMREDVRAGKLDPRGGWLFDLFRSLGYVTLFGENSCHNLAGSSPTIFFKGPFRRQLIELRARFDSTGLTDAACHIVRSIGRSSFYNGPDEACVHGRYLHDYYLDYAASFFAAQRESPKALFVTLIEAHEQNNRRTRSIDRGVARFIRGVLAKSRELGQETVFTLYSDHGVVYGNFYEKSAAGRQENALPLLYVPGWGHNDCDL
jgi:hypothetical protein